MKPFIEELLYYAPLINTLLLLFSLLVNTWINKRVAIVVEWLQRVGVDLHKRDLHERPAGDNN